MKAAIHHISVLASDAAEAYQFYHGILGLSLHLKTVNQDDPTMYHLFFSDETGREGTEFTVFETKTFPKHQSGTNALERTVFWVANQESLIFWKTRLNQAGVSTEWARLWNQEALFFSDPDGQKLALVYPEKLTWQVYPPKNPSIDPSNAILGLAGVVIRVQNQQTVTELLTRVFGFEEAPFFDAELMGDSRLDADSIFPQHVWIVEDKEQAPQQLGRGGIHHLALGVGSLEELKQTASDLSAKGILHSRIVNRDFMHSLYFKEWHGMVLEVATPISEKLVMDYDTMESFHHLPLYLPDFLEPNRMIIEEGLKQ
ncbi:MULTISPECIES: VOC family protein [unclassified Streptococcus]|uniref:VOC family protein n=1 Tax=unclassified Streptococcus TaxID=2608887 RepID=UPI0018AB45C4|nr:MULTISPECIES: VOC family protein [unclassified Streptococcus]MBF8970382.1 VOC family protein [Streptococcus sp. NLN76]MBG9367584.1 VOC family protein [Streptococcus sp. NLN64]